MLLPRRLLSTAPISARSRVFLPSPRRPALRRLLRALRLADANVRGLLHRLRRASQLAEFEQKRETTLAADYS